MSTESIGEKLRKLREKSQMPFKVGALMDIDVAILSKMERGERRLTKEIVQKLAELYKHDVEELTVLYLCGQVLYEIGDEDLALKALKVAEEHVAYANSIEEDKKSIISTLKVFLHNEKRITDAWLFSSFARGDENCKSDIDLRVRFDIKRKISLFDFADIEYQLEQITKRKIDLVEEGCLLPFAYETAKNDLLKICG